MLTYKFTTKDGEQKTSQGETAADAYRAAEPLGVDLHKGKFELVPAGAPSTQAPATPQPQMGGGGAVGAQPQGGGFEAPQQNASSSQFQGYLQTAIDKLNSNSELLNQRQLLIKHLYDDDKLSQQDMQNLPEPIRKAIASGDRSNIEMQLRLINDGISGRANTLNQSINFLTSAYKEDLAATEKKKDDARKMIEDAVTRAGSAAFANYSASTRRQLEQAAGYPTGYLDNVAPSISQTKAADGSDLTPYQVFQATQALKNSVQRKTAAASELKRQTKIMNDTYDRLESGDAKDLNATSQAIITTFNKILDPTSVVRESEYDRTGAGQALLETIGGKLAAVTQGGPGLTKESLKELVALANKYTEGSENYINQTNKSAREEAIFFGLNPDFVTYQTGQTAEEMDSAYADYLNAINH